MSVAPPECQYGRAQPPQFGTQQAAERLEFRVRRRVGQVSASILTHEGAPSKLCLGGGVTRGWRVLKVRESAMTVKGEEA
jgi:hypothetical protein